MASAAECKRSRRINGLSPDASNITRNNTKSARGNSTTTSEFPHRMCAQDSMQRAGIGSSGEESYLGRGRECFRRHIRQVSRQNQGELTWLYVSPATNTNAPG